MIGSVLVIDDDLNIQNLLEHNLRGLGYTLEMCTDGAKGLERVRDKRPALVLLDVLMPEVDGWSVLEALKSIRSKLAGWSTDLFASNPELGQQTLDASETAV